LSNNGGARVAVQLASAEKSCPREPAEPSDEIQLLVDGVDVWSALPGHVKAAILSLVTPVTFGAASPLKPR
jgi:hypothetical protein